MSDSPTSKPPGNDADKQSRESADPSAWIGMTSLGFEFLAAVLIPGAVGWWLDGKLGWTPWLMLAGGLLGFAVGLNLLFKAAGKAFGKK